MTLTEKFGYAIRHPHHFSGFARFQMSRLMHRGKAEIRFPGGELLTGYDRYSEWQGAKEDFISSAECSLLRRLPLDGGTMLDVGGNVGAFSLIFSNLHPAIQIHCFEPAPATYALLQQNLRVNKAGRIIPVPAAVTVTSGQAAFWVMPGSSAKSRLASGAGGGIQVPAWSLNDYCQANGLKRIAFLKVDVEGYEEEVFGGARRLLESAAVDCIYYEVCPELGRILNRDSLAPTRLLESQGYRIYCINADGFLTTFYEPAVRAAKVMNLVAATPDFSRRLVERSVLRPDSDPGAAS